MAGMAGMVERVARAIANSDGMHPEAWRPFEVNARAAIEAMREPTEGMIDAGFGYTGYPEEAYKEMIDAALKEAE